MSTSKTIGNPISVGLGAIGRGARSVEHGIETLGSHDMTAARVRRLTVTDLRRAMQAGVRDFSTMRTDVMFLVLIYPIIGVALAGLAFNEALVPLLFPIAAGFALVGPILSIGLYAMSRTRELRGTANWFDAFAALRADTIVPLLAMAGYLGILFFLWLWTADTIHGATMGGSYGALLPFLSDVLTTEAGWSMIVIGMGAGFVFACVALVTTFVAAPMLVDRKVGLPVAVSTSIRVARASPGVVLLWGFIVAMLLAIGSAPLFLGLIVVLPILGHATWHLYRRAVRFDDMERDNRL
ncbi:DUF2189 domain-containing protein [Maritimibacter sp. DP1N21-5]|uniref:DUF2189 domain-containing protein n=1 Tax=Maritimibacter sp. DP1N21-5 TaxID=2836867 RepID=UPI001C475184|nr:DUF2189 domain-containing protein [Maritimibacter sp. DP1N21-5]MBV7408400.1 DUF2189 domain-containing protein [Maritimibacter sp. DP1N21-5]